MGALKKKPRQGILIHGHKYKDGANVLRKSKVDVVAPDGNSHAGVKLGVRIASDQTVRELRIARAEIHGSVRWK